MKSSSCRGMEVFDFNLEDEPSDKYLGKFRNHGMDDDPSLKYKFLECVAVAPISNTSTRQTAVPCVDIDEVGDDHNEDNSLSITSSGTTREDTAAPKSSAKISSSLQFDSLGDVPHCHGGLSNKKCGNSFCESDILSTSPLASSEECADVNSDVDECMNEQASSLASDEDDVSLDGQARNDQISSPLVGSNEVLVIFPEYAVYRGDYYAEPLLEFSASGIKFKGSAANLEGKSITVECAMDDIVNISGQWSPKVETVLIKILIISKDAVQVDNVQESSGGEELKLAVVDANWYGKQEIIQALNGKYADVWHVVIDSNREIDERDTCLAKSYFPNFDEPFEDLVYPKGDLDAICISKRDVDLLQPEIFINDTIIDFYINYLKNQMPQEERQRFYFFNSFFFRKLADLDKDPNSAADGRAAFLRVRKWTRKVNLFEKDYSFIPVNYSLHWSLIIICHPGEVANVGDEDLLKASKVPCILHMDSIRGSHSGLKNLIQRYLWEEWKEKGNDSSEEMSERFANMRFVNLEVPQQENSYDCGLFLLHNLELFVKQAPSTFNPFKISKFSRFLTPDWFPPVEGSLKRTVIQKLIRELLIGDRNVSSSSDGDHSLENDDTKIENGFGGASLAETCGSALAYRSTPQPSSSIEISLLPEAENPQSNNNNEPNLVLREFFESEPAAGSFLQSYDHQPSYCPLDNNPVLAMEADDVEAGTNVGFASYGATEETAFAEINRAVAAQSGFDLENLEDKVIADSQETSPHSSPDIAIYEITNDKELAAENLEQFGKTETVSCSAEVVLERVEEVEKAMMPKSEKEVALESCDIDKEGKLAEQPLETEDVDKNMKLMEDTKLEMVTETMVGEPKEVERASQQVNPILPLHEGKNEDIATEDLSSKRDGETKESEHAIQQENPIMPLHQEVKTKLCLVVEESKDEDIATEDVSSKRDVSDIITVVVDPEEPDAKRRRLLEDNDLHL